MKLSLLRAAARIPSSELEDFGPVVQPLGEPVSRLRGRVLEEAPDGALEAGVWECTPGRWHRQIRQAEFCHFLSGRCTFTTDGGEKIEIAAGDAVFFPARTTGIWDVHETVRKTYVTFWPGRES